MWSLLCECKKTIEKMKTLFKNKSILFLSLLISVNCYSQSSTKNSINQKPNIILIFCDDLGYGDLSSYGSETIKTPRLDMLAKEGTSFTDFYVQPVCGPSRSALLTGRYPVRSAGWSMPESEITIAEALKKNGYTTACIGKWDLSNRQDIKGRIPNDQGFDYYWGTLGANDGGEVTLYDNRKNVGKEQDMAGLTRRYTNKGIDFIKATKINLSSFIYLTQWFIR